MKEIQEGFVSDADELLTKTSAWETEALVYKWIWTNTNKSMKVKHVPNQIGLFRFDNCPQIKQPGQNFMSAEYFWYTNR